jgi:hypothetical protein
VQRQSHVVIAGCLASLAAAEWLRGNAVVWVWLAGLAAVAALVLALRRPAGAPREPLTIGAAAASVVLGAVLAGGALRVWRIECCWPALREQSVPATSRALQKSLGAATPARPPDAATASSLPRAAIFNRLRSRWGRQTIERGVAIPADTSASPIARLGRHRMIPIRRRT